MNTPTNLLQEMFSTDQKARPNFNAEAITALDNMSPLDEALRKSVESKLPALELIGSETPKAKWTAARSAKRAAQKDATAQNRTPAKSRPEVQANEYFSDFARLAHEFFGDSKYAALFAAINGHLKHIIQNDSVVVIIEKGQKLLFPLWEDCEKFDLQFGKAEIPNIRTVLI
jgi:hypothetical protein